MANIFVEHINPLTLPYNGIFWLYSNKLQNTLRKRGGVGAIIRNSDPKLLGVIPLQSGRGEDQADAVFEMLKFMSTDITSSNTGRRIGACALLCHKLKRDLIFFGMPASYVGACGWISLQGAQY